MLNKLGLLLLAGTLCTCSFQTGNRQVQKDPEVLFIFADGRMLFRDRYLNQDDVVIYADGFGGERAAVKLLVPVKPDYYRDSIKVIRISSDNVPTAGEKQEVVN